MLLLLPAFRSLGGSELPVTAMLNVLTTPTLGGSGSVIWCGLADLPISAATLNFTVEAPDAAGKAVSKPLSLNQRKPAEVEYEFDTPLPGRYRILARLDWAAAQGTASKLYSLALEIAPDGKVSSVPDVTALNIANRIGWNTGGESIQIENTCSGSPVATLVSAAPDFKNAAWQPYAPMLALASDPSAPPQTLYCKVRDAAGMESDAVSLGLTPPAVVFPDKAGAIFHGGKSMSIQWSGFTGSTVAIDLYNGKTLVTTIAKSATNSGSFSWTIPTNLAVSNAYTIHISSTLVLGQTATSVVFTISTPRVLTPAAGALWFAGHSYTVTWSGIYGSSVMIEICKARTHDRTIALSTPNTGSLTFTLPSYQAAGNNFNIHIVSIGVTNEEAWSASPFTICNPAITYPDAASIGWQPGHSYNITWNGFVGTNVRIDLYKGTVRNRIISSSTPNDGLFNWTVPADQILGSDYRVRITSIENPTFVDSSTNSFSVTVPHVTYPTASGVVWVAGQSRTIIWSGFTGSNVRIELMRGTALDRTIAATTPNDGSFAWTVPAMTSGTNFKIRITSLSDATQTDLSDNTFSIAVPRVINPSDSGITVHRGQSVTITWSGFICANVRIEAYQGSALLSVLASTTTNDGSKSVTVGGDAPTGSNFKIKIISTTDSSQYDWSNNSFSIAR